MSTHTGKTHLGLAVNAEELEHDGIIAGNSQTLALLIDRQKGVDWTIDNLRKENGDLQGLLNTATEKLAQAEIKLAGLSKPAKEEK